MAYRTVVRQLERTELIKHSRFVAQVTPLTDAAEVEQHLKAARETYPDASHHCYAYRFGNLMKFSDDGEPGGTAGRPMLEVLQKRELNCVLGVVTRYFGGTRLGAGGLVRAYSGSLAKALDEAGVREVKDRSQLSFSVPFDQADTVYRLLDKWPALSKERNDYGANGLRLDVSLLSAEVQAFQKRLQDSTRGQVRWESES